MFFLDLVWHITGWKCKIWNLLGLFEKKVCGLPMFTVKAMAYTFTGTVGPWAYAMLVGAIDRKVPTAGET